MITVEEAERKIARHAPQYEAESVPTAEAHGAVLREDIRTERDLPPFDRSTMDGIAIAQSAWVKGVRRFKIEATQQAGHEPLSLHDAQNGCLQVMTGAVLPAACDGVIPFEQIRVSDNTAELLPDATFEKYQHVHRQGTDRKAGELLLPAGCRLGGPQLAIVASTGRASVNVSRRPSVAVVSIGDELIPLGAPAKAYQIFPSNAFGIEAALRDFGLKQIQLLHLKDDLADIQARLGEALASCDVIILSGGVSKGTYDFVPEALEQNRVKKIFQTVSQKPGRPLWFGISQRKTPVFALPGNPVSTLVCLHRYVLPQLAASMGATLGATLKARTTMDEKISGTLTHFLPVHVQTGADGVLEAVPEKYHGSGDYASLGLSTGFIELPRGQTVYPRGCMVSYYPWRF